MPKIVDHDQRRLELVDATWRIIARHGIEGATMREVALEAGFANGALKPYFPTKDALLTFAFGHVFNRTNERIAGTSAGKVGLEALRAFCQEVLPLDEDRINEARIVIPFWQKALTDPAKAQLHETSMNQWRATMEKHLHQARGRGEVTAAAGDEDIVNQLMSMLLGAQIVAAMSPGEHLPAQLSEALDAYLLLLRA
ncbi:MULTISPECIES: TetR/AcrR family transcriptional regulator [unclassified Arthrobacter]|uniref:TetR/AcrR family transcriptional regulator n=1 Tax=unclassified Arthrobacter TaxID=235627 RepID=UPI00159D6883|nr:TetR/AcrR family transcriptional regulator [Arthrobacter sp. STN4]MCQ9162836.1 TetR/AcrR family transcriptional regulator [Arthrobacter sp. STN4]NVM98984.1 TetR/AcrR family transcriptional regulator [Arthrobacter sp. SDTb3-6]